MIRTMNRGLNTIYIIAYSYMVIILILSLIILVASFQFGYFDYFFGDLNDCIVFTLAYSSPIVLYWFFTIFNSYAKQELLFFCFSLYTLFDLLYAGFTLFYFSSSFREFLAEAMFVPFDLFIIYLMMRGCQRDYFDRLSHVFDRPGVL